MRRFCFIAIYGAPDLVTAVQRQNWLWNLFIYFIPPTLAKKRLDTAGTGLFTAPENGWEIHWSLFKFPNHLHWETMV